MIVSDDQPQLIPCAKIVFLYAINLELSPVAVEKEVKQSLRIIGCPAPDNEYIISRIHARHCPVRHLPRLLFSQKRSKTNVCICSDTLSHLLAAAALCL